jgi:chemotaxis protein CheC
MIAEDIALSVLERDALTELVNIGVGRAATSLCKMVGKRILLSVPAVEVVTCTAAVTLLGEREADLLVAIRQDFDGPFSGRAMLILPQSNSLALLRAVTGNEMSDEQIAEIEQEALAETGNVILNSCLGSMANMLQRTLSMSLPQVVHGDGRRLFEVVECDEDDSLVLFLYINFAVQERDIRGYIAMLMDLPALVMLKQLIADFIARVIGEEIVLDDANSAISKMKTVDIP